MSGWKVEFAVGFTDGAWERHTVSIPERIDYVLDEDEVREKACKIVDEVIDQRVPEGREVSFRTILYVMPPEDNDLAW